MSIMLDSIEGSRLATQHLIDLGHTRIAHIAGGIEFTVSQSRIEGWQKALAGSGLPASDPFRGDWYAQSGYEMGKRIIASGEFTAVCAANDLMAQGLLFALYEEGIRVPQDFSVVGFDDIPEASFFIPPLTTIRQDYAELGRRCIAAVMARLHSEPEVRFEPLVPDLVVRQSSGPAPKSI